MNRLVLLIFIALPLPAYAASEQIMVDESRKAIQNFAGKLKGELQQGMAKGGPEAAIQVCHNVAADIADDVSQQYGWNIGRTSLKVRNPDNTPDPWELKVLNDFEKRKTNGEDITKMEYYETIQTDGKGVFRYMKAIPTGGLCLSCHGENISVKVIDKLDAFYPEDKARGFKTGDIRGAFTITRPLN